MRTVLALVLIIAACGPSKKDEPGRKDGCLELPAAPRRVLRAHGGALYWIEASVKRDYEGDISSYERLVRYDLATHVPTVLVEHVIGPVHFLRDGIAVVVQVGTTKSLLLLRNGRAQSLLPDWYIPQDVEPISDTTLAVLATADNKRSVYILELANPRPAFLVDAEVLLSATRDKVFIRTMDAGYVVDIATGAQEKRDIPDGSLPDGEDIYFVENEQVRIRSLRTGDTKTIIEEKRPWTMIYQDSSVLARDTPASDTTHAVLLDDGKAKALPLLDAGTSIVGTTRDGAQMWALIGHNTSNIDGDLWTATHEADVCKIDPEKVRLSYTARSIPERFMPKLNDITNRLTKLGAYRSAQVLEYDNEPLTLQVDYETNGGADLDELRERVRSIHENVTSILGDKEARTSLTFRDGKAAVYRWQRSRLRGLALAGMGSVLLSDPADHDVEIADAVFAVEKDKIVCRGKITNVRRVVLRDLEVRCIASDRERVVAIASLDPKQTVTFDEKLEWREGDYLVMEVFRGRNELVVRDMTAEKKLEALYAYLFELHAQTGFAVRNRITHERFYVLVDAPRDYTLEEVAEIEKRITEKRELFEASEDYDLELQVYADKKYYDWNGVELVPSK